MIKTKEQLKKEYFNSKKKLDKLRDNITLKKWKILSEAYIIGKEIWGRKFTIEKLAFDMEMPMTTVLRCLSLDRASKRSWDLVKEGKLSAFKLAMICQSKSHMYQDEITDMVVKDKLSTYQIKTIKVRGIEDVNEERHRLACENGYSRKSSAYTNFTKWADRGKIFLLMNRSHLPENKKDEVISKLKKLNKNIEIYLKNWK